MLEPSLSDRLVILGRTDEQKSLFRKSTLPYRLLNSALNDSRSWFLARVLGSKVKCVTLVPFIGGGIRVIRLRGDVDAGLLTIGEPREMGRFV